MVQDQVKSAHAECEFFYLTCDEVMTVDNQTWISVHFYIANAADLVESDR